MWERALAADERAARSRKGLSKRYGALLKSWATARAADWQIDSSWGVADVLAKLERLCTVEVWTSLAGASKEVAALDSLMRIQLGAFVSTRPRPEQPDELNIEEVFNLMRIWFPDISRARVRTLLFRTERAGLAFRERRGVYIADEWGFRKRDRRDFGDLDDKRMERWDSRSRRAVVALTVHYLLPWLPVYRKARALHMSDRNFHYALSMVIEDIAEHLEWQQTLKRRNVQS